VFYPKRRGAALALRRRVGGEKDARVELGDAVPAAEREPAIDLAPEELEHPEDAVLSGAGDAPEARAADQNRARPERQRLERARGPSTAAGEWRIFQFRDDGDLVEQGAGEPRY
jgi:hypothetical protein